MQDAAERLDFEQAAVLRDRLKALTFIQGSQAINAEGMGDADIFALACLEGVIGIQAFFIRGGQNWGHRSFFPAHTNEVAEDEVLLQFMTQFYEEVPPPRQILLDRTLSEQPLLEEALSGSTEHWQVIFGPLLVIVALFAPGGLIGAGRRISGMLARGA